MFSEPLPTFLDGLTWARFLTMAFFLGTYT